MTHENGANQVGKGFTAALPVGKVDGAEDGQAVAGLGAGAAHWSAYAEEALRLRLVAPHPFDGLVVDKGVKTEDASGYLVALGAALAGAEVSA